MRKYCFVLMLLSIRFFTYTQTPDANNILYVNINVSGGNGSGNSWANAIPQLADALKYARQQNNYTNANPLKIYVAKGTYKPLYDAENGNFTNNGGRRNSFVLVKNVQLYGGFDPTAGITTLAHNRIVPTANGAPIGGGTILSGDIDNDNILNDGNVYHVVISAGDVGNTVLEGFSITKGYGFNAATSVNVGSSSMYNFSGIGMYIIDSSPTISNMYIYDNTATTLNSEGGGMCIKNSSSSISNVCVENNSASYGGGIYNSGSLNLSNIKIKNNSGSAGNFGIGIYNNGTLTIQNIEISKGHPATSGGSAIFNSGNISLTNATIASNAGTSIRFTAGSLTIKNSILYGSISNIPAVNTYFSLIEGSSDVSNGNIDATGIIVNDIFTNPSAGDFSLIFSVILNNGNSALFTGLNASTKDLAGNPRLVGASIDLGAYEYQTAIVPDVNNIVYVKPIATGNKTGISWNDATADLHNAIHTSGVQKVFVAVGTYNAGTSSFIMKNGVEIYGGFDPVNGITTLAHSRILPTESVGGSVLNGQDQRQLIWNDNNGLNNTAILDGFTLTNGKASNSGGAVYNRNTAPAFNNLVIKNSTAAESGGAICNQNAPIKLSNTIITNNTALYGGGIRNNGSASEFTNVVIKNNSATMNTGESGGGGIFNENSALKLTNVLIANNSTNRWGGGFRNISGNPVFTNVTFANNTAVNQTATAAMEVKAGTPQINNSIILGTVSGSYTPKYSMIQGNADFSNGNIAASGLTDVFTNPSAGNYTLKVSSPAGNAGNNTLFTGLNAGTKDLAGNPRLTGVFIDLGAYEHLQAIIPDVNGTVYVRTTAFGKQDGSSWNDATSDLHNSIHTTNVQKVFVATGNYNTGTNSFIMKNGVEIYGGFDPANGITTLAHNRILPTETVSGSVLNGENTRPVIWNVNNSLSSTAILDGFTVKNGYYSGDGGGIRNVYASPTLRNLVIRDNHSDNWGGGVYNRNSSPVITGVLFLNNSAAVSGGGIYNDVSTSSVISNSVFKNNSAPNASAIYSKYVTDIISSQLTDNQGNFAIVKESAITLTNVTIANNGPNAFRSISGGTFFNNSIVFGAVNIDGGTYTPKNSFVEGNTNTANGNINTTGISLTDIFADAANGNYTLKPASPVINAGNNTLFTGLDVNTKDLTGNARLTGVFIDLGAYEYPQSIIPDVNGTVYVRTTPFGKQDGSSWNDATSDLHNSIHTTNVQKVFVAIGNYSVGANSFIMKNNVAIYGGFDPANGITTLAHNRILPTELVGGSVLNGENTRPLIWNNNNNLNNTALLDGFTLMNGKTSGNGGAIFNNNTAPAFNNLVIKNSEAVTSGGAIYNVNAPIKMSNTIITNNTALYGGAIRNDKSHGEFTNVIIKNNSATMNTGGSGGGGIFNELSDLKLTNVLITGNSTNRWGGGFRNLSGNPVFTNVTIVNNTAVNQTATTAMQIEAGTPQINNSIVYGTVSGAYTAQYSLIEGSTNTANGNLDATGITPADIFTNAPAGDYTLKNGSVAVDAGNNILFTGLNGTTKDLAGNARVYNLTIGGVIDLGAYESSFTGNNIIPDVNGIVYVRQGYVGNGSSWANATGSFQGAVDGTNVQKVYVAAGNYNAPSGSFKMKNNVEIYGGFDPGNGISTLSDVRILPTETINGSVLNGDNIRVVIRNIFTSADPMDNTAILDGFTIANGQIAGNAFGGGMYNVYASPVLRNLLIKNNILPSGGGAGMANNNSSPLLTNVIITGNEALRGGGMYNVDNSSPVLTNVVIKNNTATNTSNFGGAGMFNQASSPVLVNVDILNNTAIYTGGGIFAQSNSYIQASNTRIENNTATSGGGIYMNSSTLVFLGGTFKNDSATERGGGIYVQGTSNIQISNSVMEGNLAQVTGGGIHMSGTTAVLTDMVFKHNTATTNGGGFYAQNNTNVQVSNSTVENNTANNGGGVYITASTLTMNDLIIENNTANTTGGGLYVSINSSNVQVVNSTVENNTALYGGGLYNNGSPSQFTDVIFKGNSATMSGAGAGGGGIFNQSAALKLTDVLIVNNSTNFQGGGFRNLSGNPVLTNVTIANNTAVNSATTTAIDIAGGTPQINNSIIYGTVTGSYTPQYSLIEGNTDFTNGNINPSAYSLSAVFTDPANGDYTLLPSSPAINAGNNTLFTGLDEHTKDLAGDDRVFDFINAGIIDLGAYEFAGSGSPLPITLTSFAGTCNTNGVQLSWTTATENNVNHFEIYRSRNGQTWEKVTEVNAVGSSSTANTYHATDAKGAETMYYKLRSVDNDATDEDFNPIAVRCDIKGQAWSLHPVPAATHVTITIETDKAVNDNIVIMDMDGRAVQTQAVNLEIGVNYIILDVQNFAKGTYMVKMNNETEYKPVKLMKID